MKEVLYVTLALFLASVMRAQSTSGEVRYEEVVQLQIDFDGPEEMKALLPTSQSNVKSLAFTETETLYKDVDPADNEQVVEAGSEDGGMQMKFVVMRPDEQLYLHLKDKKMVHQRDFMGKKFLIKGDIKQRQWKLTGEQKNIQGYTCMKALLQDTSRQVEAWFTPQIPVSAGPDLWGGLPGIILELTDAKNQRAFTAIKVELKSLEAGAIAIPEKGKVVTEAEYDQIVEEKTKEMQMEMGGEGSGMKIEIRH